MLDFVTEESEVVLMLKHVMTLQGNSTGNQVGKGKLTLCYKVSSSFITV
jgi:hypothetical protein